MFDETSSRVNQDLTNISIIDFERLDFLIFFPNEKRTLSGKIRVGNPNHIFCAFNKRASKTVSFSFFSLN